jgi:glutamate N-acetyltransferase / amino-acid N-acetyltransferase
MSSCPIPDINIPGGFRWSAVKAGIKASGRPDLALAEAPLGASAAAVYTTNRVCAAPLVVDKANLKKTHGRLRALLVNAGNANCATGKPGISAANQSCEALGRALEVAPEFIFPSSTGIIGVPLPIEKIIAAIPELVRERASDSASALAFAEAIMTTDTRMKCDSSSLSFVGKHFSILGMAKGSGMIHPNMATMLAYIFTDIEAPPAELQVLLKEAVSKTFNAISVDGDTSTNDTVLLMASGASGARLNRGNKSLFVGMLEELCYGLAEDIVRDGEGAKHLVRLHIEQAKNGEEARQIARSIANSPLVKTAWAGSDPNWGRILSSIGKSGVDLDPSKVSIFIGPQQVCKKGMSNSFDENAAHEYLKQPEFDIRVQLGRGKATLNFLTCDLTTEYVHINADYST